MLLQVCHLTRYEYVTPVCESINEARLQPLTTATQRCQQFNLSIEPAVRVSDFVDFYKNPTRHFAILQPHGELVLRAESLTETFPEAFVEPVGDFPSSMLKGIRYSQEIFDFLGTSHFVDRHPDIWKCAVDLRNEDDDLYRNALTIMNWVYQEFTYQPSATLVQTGSLEAFRLKQGVCQDYAHVMLALCRAVEIPARYVSGYFWIPNVALDPAAGASHAWVEVFLPGYGWRGLDPTHNRAVDETYVKVAIGRDYHDIRPVSGTYRGGDVANMQVEALVTDARPVSACV